MGIGFNKPKVVGGGDAVFINAHGVNDITSVSVLNKDPFGYEVDTIQAGQILAKVEAEGGYLPIRIAYVKKKVTSQNVVEVDNAALFSEGAIVELNGAFRAITKITLATNELTLSGDPLTLEAGDLVKLSQGYNGRLATKKVTGSSGTTTINVSRVSCFKGVKEVSIKGTKYPVASVDTSQDTLTITGNVSLEIGEPVVGEAPSKYKIAIATVKVKGEMNVLVPTRGFGRVRKSALKGFDDSLIPYFKNIEFEDMR